MVLSVVPRGVLALLLLALLVPSGCLAPAPQGPTLRYEVGPCDESVDAFDMEPQVEITVHDGVIHISEDVGYVCCADIVLRLEREGDLIKVIETNEGEVCRCMCAYHIEANIAGLAPGSYRVQVWGIAYEDIHPLELLREARVDL